MKNSNNDITNKDSDIITAGSKIISLYLSNGQES